MKWHIMYMKNCSYRIAQLADVEAVFNYECQLNNNMELEEIEKQIIWNRFQVFKLLHTLATCLVKISSHYSGIHRFHSQIKVYTNGPN